MKHIDDELWEEDFKKRLEEREKIDLSTNLNANKKRLYKVEVEDGRTLTTHAYTYDEAISNVKYRVQKEKEKDAEMQKNIKQDELEKELLLFILKKSNGLDRYRIENTLERVLNELKNN